MRQHWVQCAKHFIHLAWLGLVFILFYYYYFFSAVGFARAQPKKNVTYVQNINNNTIITYFRFYNIATAEQFILCCGLSSTSIGYLPMTMWSTISPSNHWHYTIERKQCKSIKTILIKMGFVKFRNQFHLAWFFCLCHFPFVGNNFDISLSFSFQIFLSSISLLVRWK